MSTPIKFKIAAQDFIAFFLPEDSVAVGTENFKKAVRNYYAKEFAHLGGKVSVIFEGDIINIEWLPREAVEDPFEYAIDLLQHGEHQKAVPLLETILASDPQNADALYNLGMALSDMGQLEQAKRYLSRLTELSPKFSNAYVALGVAHQRSGDSEQAVMALQRAIEIDTDNGYAHRNLAGVLGSLGRLEEAAEHFRAAYQLMPEDQAAVYGLAQSLEASGNEEKLAEADQLYLDAIKINPATQIAEFARQARNKFAEKSFKSSAGGTTRPDAIMYCLSALQNFSKMKSQEARNVTFEIAMIGRNGLDTNDPTQKYRLRSLAGSYSGLQLVAMMYVGFKQIDPQLDIGFDLSNEYELAQQLFTQGEDKP